MDNQFGSKTVFSLTLKEKGLQGFSEARQSSKPEIIESLLTFLIWGILDLHSIEV